MATRRGSKRNHDQVCGELSVDNEIAFSFLSIEKERGVLFPPQSNEISQSALRTLGVPVGRETGCSFLGAVTKRVG